LLVLFDLSPIPRSVTGLIAFSYSPIFSFAAFLPPNSRPNYLVSFDLFRLFCFSSSPPQRDHFKENVGDSNPIPSYFLLRVVVSLVFDKIDEILDFPFGFVSEHPKLCGSFPAMCRSLPGLLLLSQFLFFLIALSSKVIF